MLGATRVGVHIGNYRTIEQATVAADAARAVLFGDFAGKS